MITERIVIIEDGADLLPEAVVREPANDARALEAAPFAGTGPGRGEYEAAVEYLPPQRRVA
jgi:hypothetical protein